MGDRVRERALEDVAKALAFDNIGTYPASSQVGNEPPVMRTEWQDGWNACQDRFLHEWGRIENWMDSLPEEHKALVEDLLIDERLGLMAHEGKPIYLYVNCSDTFVWGCADLEPIVFEELGALKDCLALSPKYGGELWVARKRGMRPQWASYKECYPESEWALFDAAGPERSDSDGLQRR